MHAHLISKNQKHIKKIRIFEAFAGIGTQIQALKDVCKKTNYEAESIGVIDWFVHAIVAYRCLHYGYKPKSILSKEQMTEKLKQFSFSTDSKKINSTFLKKIRESHLQEIFPYLLDFVKDSRNFTNILTCNKLPEDIDIFTYSFPCQDLSSQGKQLGFQEGTRSSLLFEIERILNNNLDNLPRTLLMENVANFASKRFIDYLNKWINILKKIGYKSEYMILNAKDYGSPQNRRRVFLVSWLDKDKKFNWPEKILETVSLHKIVDMDWQEDNCWQKDKLNKISLSNLSEFKKTTSGIIKAQLYNYTTFNAENFVYSCDGFGPTLTATGANSKIKIFIEHKQQIRYLNSMECGQYMGFNKNMLKDLERIKFLKKSKLVFLFGNSISIELLKSIFNSMIDSFFV